MAAVLCMYPSHMSSKSFTKTVQSLSEPISVTFTIRSKCPIFFISDKKLLTNFSNSPNSFSRFHIEKNVQNSWNHKEKKKSNIFITTSYFILYIPIQYQTFANILSSVANYIFITYLYFDEKYNILSLSVVWFLLTLHTIFIHCISIWSTELVTERERKEKNPKQRINSIPVFAVSFSFNSSVNLFVLSGYYCSSVVSLILNYSLRICRSQCMCVCMRMIPNENTSREVVDAQGSKMSLFTITIDLLGIKK